jgi:uncharacterized protein (TIGR00290 family)
VILTVLNETGAISRAHGIPPDVLQAQAAAMRIPAKLVASSWSHYEAVFTTALRALQAEFHLTHIVFGDIDLLEHRQWEEKVCASVGVEAHLPLWKKDTNKLVRQVVDTGITAVIVSCNDTMGPAFIGRQLTRKLIRECEQKGIDPCGEGGEFHTLVTHCPLFTHPLKVTFSEPHYKEGFWYGTPSLI